MVWNTVEMGPPLKFYGQTLDGMFNAVCDNCYSDHLGSHTKYLCFGKMRASNGEYV